MTMNILQKPRSRNLVKGILSLLLLALPAMLRAADEAPDTFKSSPSGDAAPHDRRTDWWRDAKIRHVHPLGTLFQTRR